MTDDNVLYAGVETGGTKVLCRLETVAGAVLHEARFPTEAPEPTVERVAVELSAAASGGRIAAVGVASFGPVVVDPTSRDYGRLLATPKPGWSGFDLRAALAERLGAPVIIDTDVNAAALAEQRRGRGGGSRRWLTSRSAPASAAGWRSAGGR